ncbi:hypothetical protein ACTMU2_35020 [Cupriavidus basilensis]
MHPTTACRPSCAISSARCASARRGLRVYVLSWDFGDGVRVRARIPAGGAAALAGAPALGQSRLDGNHPPGASHHQKIVVIDHRLAFVGGLDLDDPPLGYPRTPCQRSLAVSILDGKPYAPFHDVQCMVDGKAARALGDLAAERWLRATGRHPRVPVGGRCRDPRPAEVSPDVTDAGQVGISRTDPGARRHARRHRNPQKLHTDATRRRA